MTIIEVRTKSGSIYQINNALSEFRKIGEPWHKGRCICSPEIGKKMAVFSLEDENIGFETSKVISISYIEYHGDC
jgi:hypothetical protein